MEHSYEPHQIQWTFERVAKLWDYYSSNPSYDSTYFSMHSGLSILNLVRRHLSLEGMHILDFGCGQGHMLRHLLDAGISCKGIEFSQDSAKSTQQSLENHPLFGGVTHTKTLPTSLQDGCTDIALLIEVFEHLFEDQILPTLREIYRLLRPRGYIVVTTPHAENLESSMIHCPECGCTFHRWQHMRSVTVETLSHVASQAGFRSIVCQPTYFKPSGSWMGLMLLDLRKLYRRMRGFPPETPHLIYIGQRMDRST